MKWSKIQKTMLATEAYILMCENYGQGCTYHNLTHIGTMYDFLDGMNVTYDETLDWAVMFHDVVYDEKPDKEKRSAEWFLEMHSKDKGTNLDEEVLTRIVELIMATKDHLLDIEDKVDFLKGKKEIIMADLHQLTSIKETIVNYSNIMQESMSLYEISEKDFAKGNKDFLTGLKERVTKNIKRSDTVEEQRFFAGVVNGIDLSISFSEAVLKS